MSDYMSTEDATRIIDEAIKGMEECAEAIKNRRDGGPLPLSMNLLRHLPLIVSFLRSKPYETFDYDEEELGFSLYHRIDVLAAFKKHALCVLTDICPDCGKPRSTHNHGTGEDMSPHHEPPDRLN